jgi:hypothetical protein
VWSFFGGKKKVLYIEELCGGSLHLFQSLKKEKIERGVKCKEGNQGY